MWDFAVSAMYQVYGNYGNAVFKRCFKFGIAILKQVKMLNLSPWANADSWFQ